MQRSVFGPALGAILLSLDASAAALSPEGGEFVDEMVRKHRFERAELAQLLAQARFQQPIIDAITRPYEAKPWHQYRGLFVNEGRITGGVEFWNHHRELLAQIAAEYQVPAEILVAIVGVETRYGGYTGTYRVIDSLATLAFGYPKRAAFFRGELEEFLLLTREEAVDPLAAEGSYAGAMGMPQFISSSYRTYAVDGDGDGRRDLWGSTADVLASIANYFRRHGWRPGEPVVAPAVGVDGKAHAAALAAGMKPSLEIGTLRTAGVGVPSDWPDAEAVTLFRLDGADGDEFWAGRDNFYTITRYNHSNLYALAVYQLSQAIRERWAAATADAR